VAYGSPQLLALEKYVASPLSRDSAWIRQSFLVLADDLEEVDVQNRTHSTANFKYTDTTPGGNFAINPLPQFCDNADLNVPSRFKASQGMGRYYSEAYDDNAQIIHLRFGVARFNSLTQFFSGFYNTSAGQLARTGRSTSALYAIGRATAFVVSIMSWKLLAVHILGRSFKFFIDKPSSKFYYLKPTMPLYWNAVTTIVNQLAVNRGVVPRIGSQDQSKLNDKYEFDESALLQLHQLLPEIFMEKGGIDVYALANRAQRLAHRHRDFMKSRLNTNGIGSNYANDDITDISKRFQQIMDIRLEDQPPTYQKYLDTWFEAEASKPKGADNGESDASTESVVVDEETGLEEPGAVEKWAQMLSAEFDDGGAFASFRVNATGPMSESFSSTTTESEIANKINSMSSQSRSTNFNFANGNLGGGVVGSLVGSAITAVKDFGAGVMDQLQISGLAALGGAAFVDIPQHWQASSATLPHASYTVELRTAYNNPMSQLLNLDIPLAMLIAGALPLATGKQSYTSPFLCELYDQGRCQTRLGIIDSMTVTRGVGNLGWTNEGRATGIDVTFTVKDLSSMMYMPISAGFSLNPLDGIFDDQTTINDYFSTLAGMSLADQIYTWRRFKLNLTRKIANWNNWASISHFASWFGDIPPVRIFSALYAGTSRG